jgi:hypothetical protein
MLVFREDYDLVDSKQTLTTGGRGSRRVSGRQNGGSVRQRLFPAHNRTSGWAGQLSLKQTSAAVLQYLRGSAYNVEGSRRLSIHP